MNLIQVNRYAYFPSTKRQLEPPGSSFFERQYDEKAEGGVLASSMTINERLHQTFYSKPCASLDGKMDVRSILEKEKTKVLAGCHILFSSVDKLEQEATWQAATQFGAVCTTEMNSRVTHVISKQRGTQQVNWATESGRFIVSHKWIGTSVFLYRKANEKDFPFV